MPLPTRYLIAAAAALAASSDLLQPPLHVAVREERLAVLVRGLVLVLVEAGEEVRRQRVYGVPLVSGEFSQVGGEGAGEAASCATGGHRAPPCSAGNATVRTLSCVETTRHVATPATGEAATAVALPKLVTPVRSVVRETADRARRLTVARLL
jgi:hypothetical protein